MSISAQVILRLQAIEAGDQSVEPVTHDELVAALRERIGDRQRAVLAPKERKPTTRKPRAPKEPVEIIDL